MIQRKLADMATRIYVADSMSYFPVRTITVKTQIAEALVERGLGPVFLR